MRWLIRYLGLFAWYICNSHLPLHFKQFYSLLQIHYSWPLNNTGLNYVVHLYTDFFFSTKYYSTTWSGIGRTHRCGTSDTEELQSRYGGSTYMEGQLKITCEFSTEWRAGTPTPEFFKGQLYVGMWITRRLFIFNYFKEREIQFFLRIYRRRCVFSI